MKSFPKPYLLIKGQGTPVLILHGWGGSNASWQTFTDQAQDQFTWVMFDLAGFGKTEAPKEAWTVTDYQNWCEQIYNDLPDKIKPQYILTHSFGGRIAAKWLQKKHPFQKAILTASAGIKPEPTFKTKLLNFISKIAKKIFSESTINRFKYRFYKLTGIKDFPLDPFMQETFKLVTGEDLTTDFSKIKHGENITLIWGKDDKITPLSTGQKINKLIQDSQLIILDNCRHAIHRQQQNELIKICTRIFLNK